MSLEYRVCSLRSKHLTKGEYFDVFIFLLLVLSLISRLKYSLPREVRPDFGNGPTFFVFYPREKNSRSEFSLVSSFKNDNSFLILLLSFSLQLCCTYSMWPQMFSDMT